MQMFRSRKTKTDTVEVRHVKDWANSGHELELLGRRLDAVRSTIQHLEASKKPEDHWAVVHWRQAEAMVLLKWRRTQRLKETGLRQVGIVETGPKIAYDWWEGADEVHMGLPIFDTIGQWIHDHTVGTPSLDRAWEMARNESLQKARQGRG